jgi:hypothetical protein
MRSWKATLFTALALTAFCGNAIAQDTAGDEARDQFETGVDLFEKGQFAQASVAFARAYELRPSYKILYLVGKCENEQGHFALSLDAFTRYLAEGGDKIDQPRQDEVRKEIDKLRKRVGQVVVNTEIEGAVVFVDDEKKGTTPLPGPVFVDLGKHVVSVKQGAEELYREVVTVAGGQRAEVKIEARLAPTGEGTASDGAGGGAPATPETETPPKDPGLLIGSIAALAVGAGGVVVGGVFAAKRGDALDEVEAAETRPDYNAAADDATTDHAVMLAGFIGGGVFLAAGAVMLALDLRARKERPQEGGSIALRPIPGGLVVGF